jgi:hypothetical protein
MMGCEKLVGGATPFVSLPATGHGGVPERTIEVARARGIAAEAPTMHACSSVPVSGVRLGA